MKRISELKIGKILNALFSTRASGIYLLLFAIVIGVATFIENDFGTTAAQKVVYRTRWFEFLLVLLGVSIAVNIYKFRMIPQKKWALLTFHLAVIIIIIGAGITRYFGYEGVMHIREKGTASSFNSAEPYLKFDVNYQNQQYSFDERMLFASLGNNHWEDSYLIGNQEIRIAVLDVIPNPTRNLVPDTNGKPMVKIVIPGSNGREEYFLSQGETRRLGNTIYNFAPTSVAQAINFKLEGEELMIMSDRTLTWMQMATRNRDTLLPNGQFSPLQMRSLYSDGNNNFVIPEFYPKAQVQLVSEDQKIKNESTLALKMRVSVNGQNQEGYIYGSKGMPGQPVSFGFENLVVNAAYGSKEIRVPFTLKLNDFIMDRYPGTQSASSYASEVTLMDGPKGVNQDYRIYMNHILNYGGFRFFQSSFDRDEQGTYLSVNHDFWGTWVSYLGYALLALGMILTLFSKNTRFYELNKKIKKMQSKTTISLLLIMCSLATQGQDTPVPHAVNHAVSKNHAEQFSQLLVQDFKGRMKPIHTLSREVFRKIARKESLFGLTADQLFLSLYSNPQEWYGVPLIKLGKHDDLKRKLGVTSDFAAYRDFFATDGSYKLRNEVRRIYELDAVDRGTFEKEVQKVDERVNILSMIFNGSLLKVIPLANDPNQTWVSNNAHGHTHDNNIQNSDFELAFFANYKSALQTGTSTGNYTTATQLLNDLNLYQKQYGQEVLPSETKIKAEILLNKLNVFTRLAGGYLLLGLGFLTLLFLSVFKPRLKLKKVFLILGSILIICFLLHTVGLGLRWYISGRAPWSNGYESMIYIGWTTTLAGIIFTRKSYGGLAATTVLAGTILFVATLSFLDPEITPLVPVLKSYWLTIHVSMEAGSYGFLMLGAIIGLINLILLMFLRPSNKERIKRIVTEMSYLSEITLIAGLFMVSIGTFLGGIWANESWGRYWGWDAKETWALVTILIYAFILHMRLIPKLKGLFAYNVATIFGLASVIMTYYGVNYYLSGLHSYATGDPVPIPLWVYIVVMAILAISTLAYFKKRKFGFKNLN